MMTAPTTPMREFAPSQLLETIAEKERELDTLRRSLADHRERIRLKAGTLGVVRCRLAGRSVAFREEDVDEVVAMAELTELAGSPPWIAGLLELGRERLPVIDLAARESGTRRVVDPSEFVVIVHSSRGRFGLVVDDLEALSSFDTSDLHRPSRELPFAAHVLGVATFDGRPTLLLAVEPLVADGLVPETVP